MILQSKSRYLRSIFISCFCLMFGTLSLVSAQSAPLQRAVFRNYQLKFDYDANSYVVYHAGENELSINLRVDAPDLPTGFNPALSIRILPDTADLNQALQAYLQSRAYSGDITFRTDTTIGDLPAQQVVAAGWHTQVEIGLVKANDNIYIIEAAPNFANSQLPEAAAVAQQMWNMIVHSIDFSAAELTQEIPADCVNDSAFVRDITIPDGTQVVPLIPFTKSWELLNDGTCTWYSDYRLQLIGNTPNWDMVRWSQLAPIAPYTEPNQSAAIALTLALSTTTTTPVAHQAQYQLANAEGALFGTRPYVEVVPILDEQPPVEPPPTGGLARFSSDSFGISFTYPDSWVRIDSIPDLVSLYSYNVREQVQDTFTVPAGETKIEIINRGAGSISDATQNSDNVTSLKLTSGLPAIRMELPNPRNPQETQVAYQVEVNGTLYEFQVFGDSAQIDAIVASVDIVQ